MIIFNLDFLNTMIAVLGMLGWWWVWLKGAYKTGSTFRTQSGVIIFGIIWVMLSMADTIQDLHPTSLTVFSRVLLLAALWCCMPLLKQSPQETKDDDEVEDDEQPAE